MFKYIKGVLAKQFSTLYYFYQYLGNKLFFLLIFNFLMVLMDGFGLAMFVPLLQIADGNVSEMGGDNKLLNYVVSIFNFFNIPLSVLSVLILIVVIFVSKAFFAYFAQAFQATTIHDFSRALRVKLIKGITELTYKEFVSTNVGRIQNTLIGETQQVANASSQYVETIKNGMIVLVYLGFAFFIDWKFSLLVCIGGASTNFIYKFFYEKTKSISREITSKNHNYSGLVLELVNNFKYLKATSRNYNFENRLLNVMNSVTDDGINMSKLGAKLASIREPIMLIVVCSVIGVQVYLFQAPLSAILIILVMFYRAMAYIMSLQSTWNGYLSNIGAFENIFDFENYLNSNRELLKGSEFVSEISDIRLVDVSLYYGDSKVLNNVSLNIKKNTSIAFVGESGSGKTTLVNVICGLLKLDSGAFFVNGSDLNNLDLTNYKNKIGYISQEPTIFEGTIYDNVTFWAEKTEQSLNKFYEVLKMCSLHSFVQSLPNAENELLGNNGLNISGGQKQRISIARELYRDINILIMDEATSALDGETERYIKDSIERLQGKLTIISIAHRLSTIKNADQIYLMDKGEVIDSGTFDNLKLKSDYFNRLTSLQGL